MSSKGDCVLWRRAVNSSGYGVTRRNGRQHIVSRLAWSDKHGPIPAGMQVCHHCDNPRCINVDHLFLGTCADNMRDKVAKGRQARGVTNGRAKLTEYEAKMIRAYGGRRNNRTLAREFGISDTLVRYIVAGRNWTHV